MSENVDIKDEIIADITFRIKQQNTDARTNIVRQAEKTT